MKIDFYKLNFIVLLFATIVSCKKETEVVQFDFGYNYFPDDSGKYVIYKVDSVIFNDFDPSNLKRFSTQFVKEIVTEEFIDNLGRKAKKLERYISTDTTQPWQFWNVWYFIKNKTNVEQVEDNIRYVKLIFPLKIDDSWHGNKYFETNHFPFLDLRYTTTNFDWEYKLTEKDALYSNLNFSSDSTLTILQIADSSNVQKVYSLERYSRNVGLVYKELWRLDAQLLNDTQTYENNSKYGFIVYQRAIRFGKE
ncbi:MAG TPA: hypothetical protein PLJ42_12135 [Chitinophagales bacterium]|mgnify:FL=1|jgi:hypothetical protein|nr:hypothetical protein [Chitinophagales bacterium]HQV79277.1 hypothetical protein [Chitinophagales bacterium]HQW80173.1 hypothetical protein [Chitinophagales bacterium]HRB67271.1 hypothetical protein [Chitinophagales bacterium]HRB69795.1 hypothetical protein [Chitinophagales bacterium]